MANKTIYGCVDVSTGVITFAGEACDGGDYTGCLEATGDGRIVVAISEASCNDTYYGCINSSTGAFQLIIPDDCCIEYGIDCDLCEPSLWANGKTPGYVKLTVSGITICSGPDVNGTFYLKQTNPSIEPCHFSIPCITISGTSVRYTWSLEHVNANYVTVWVVADNERYFYDDDLSCTTSFTNVGTDCGVPDGRYIGYGGTAVIDSTPQRASDYTDQDLC